MTAKLVDDLTDTRSDKTRESWGQGVANIVTGFFGGMGGCAMIGQTMINVRSGARTRLSTFLAGVFLLVLVVALGRRRRGHPDGRPRRRDDLRVVRDLRLAQPAHAAVDAAERDRGDGLHRRRRPRRPTTSPSASPSASSSPACSSPGGWPTWSGHRPHRGRRHPRLHRLRSAVLRLQQRPRGAVRLRRRPRRASSSTCPAASSGTRPPWPPSTRSPPGTPPAASRWRSPASTGTRPTATSGTAAGSADRPRRRRTPGATRS